MYGRREDRDKSQESERRTQEVEYRRRDEQGTDEHPKKSPYRN
jgi:hypothetical protein